jgi:hypothetical protein
MTENSIIKLGFEKCIVSKEESNLDVDIHYYTYNVGNVCFVSNDSGDGQEKKMWSVEMPEAEVRFYDVKDLKCVIECLEKNKYE